MDSSSSGIGRRVFLGSGLAGAVATASGGRVMRLAIGSDHAGFPLKGPVIEMLRSWGHLVKDPGCFSTQPVVHQCVEHDDVKVLCVGNWIIGIKVAEEILQSFLDAKFSTSEEFRRRVRKLEEMEKP